MGSIKSKKNNLIVAKIIDKDEIIANNDEIIPNKNEKIANNDEIINKYQDDFTKFCHKKIEDYSKACINAEIISNKNIYSNLELEYLSKLYLYEVYKSN